MSDMSHEELRTELQNTVTMPTTYLQVYHSKKCGHFMLLVILQTVTNIILATLSVSP